MTRRNLLLATALTALAVLLAALFLGQGARAPGNAGEPVAATEVLERFHSPVVGAAGAPVTVVEFLDPACEACHAFHPYVKEILAAHPDKVRLVIRYVSFHGPVSVEAVRILEAARAQGRFEAVLEALFAAQPLWASHGAPAPERAWSLAGDAGLDLPAARAHAATGAADRLLDQDMIDVKAVRISATPTFFVNGRELPEPTPARLLAMVQAELRE